MNPLMVCAAVVTLLLGACVVSLAMKRAEQKRKRVEAVRGALRLVVADLDEREGR